MTEQRVTLITGASSGIGAATARRIAAQGESLVLHARGGKEGEKIALLEQVAQQARESGADVSVLTGDLGDTDVATGLVDEAIEQFGHLDRVVSNAGFALHKSVGEMTREDLDHSHTVITGAFFELITAALPHLIASDHGRVVAITSFVVDQVPGGRMFPATAAAKGAMEAMARTFAAQVAGEGITVNCVSPGFTEKETSGHSALSTSAWQSAADMTPDGRLARPADIAAAVAFFLSDEAAHITGQTLRVDGGLSLI
ncbi:MAG: SDR family oxidoreductase [Alphaproteobacteria bacterium]|nr:SDR family oxidoreductase [Alphaproteobacteria bacterium]